MSKRRNKINFQMINEKFYAGFWVRLFAGLLDLALLIPLGALIAYFLSGSSYETISAGENWYSYSFSASGNLRLVDLIGYVLSVAYITYFLASNKQATIGKRIMGIYVGNLDGSKLSRSHAAARAFASMITSVTLGLGFIIVIFTKEKISLHDFLCNTRVFFGKK